ncbi:hypothetical protein [Salimicrobium halophilum]|uniref:Thioredoxin n=1 Tax=Salimicrobium halophilum TaxID=86666 RepID=A0A1G8QI80_9BACI|nr:hypothetical protein [Salimicrobium halophilum]SDJ04499.1 hypothetical protein SAMN04490247_0641 [Salimicrobium halophilum]
MKYSFLLSYILLFILALQFTDPTVDVIYASSNNYEILLLAEEDKATSKPFMTALLEFKENETESFQFTKEEMSAQEVAASPKDIPSIIVKQNGSVIGKVTGESLSTQQIIDELTTILHK